MKRRLLSTAAAIALISGTALAADLPVRTLAPAPAPVAYAPAFTWAGVYGGLNIGAARRRGDGNIEFADEIDFEGGTAPIIFLDDPSGVRIGERDKWRLTGGAQVGVNGQWGNLVAGLEADFNWLGGGGRSGTARSGPLALPWNEFDCLEFGACDEVDIRARIGASRWISTVRGRLGFAWDRFLVYGTGGVAFQQAARATTQATITDRFLDYDYSGCDFEGPCVPVITQREVNYRLAEITSRRNQVGWAAGIGIEWAFFDNMSLGLEYLRADFGAYDVTYDDPLAEQRKTVRVDDKIDMARLKLNLRF